jgi:hypothetical protein
MKRSVIAAALLMAASSLPAWAQESHEAHHPPQASAPGQVEAAPAAPAGPSTRAEGPSAPSAAAPQAPAQGQMQGGMMMNCAMMQSAQSTPGAPMNCPMMQGMRPGMMQGQMQPGQAPGGTTETPKPN